MQRRINAFGECTKYMSGRRRRDEKEDGACFMIWLAVSSRGLPFCMDGVGATICKKAKRNKSTTLKASV
jgi:hypothetical protein